MNKTSQTGAVLGNRSDLTAWNIPFTGRGEEVELILRFLGSKTPDETPHRLTVHGDSGTGKSYLVKHCLFQWLSSREETAVCLYIDLSNDDFRNSRLISSVLKMAMVPALPREGYPINIPRGATFVEYQERSAKRRALGWKIITGLTQAAASFAGMGDAVGDALRDIGDKQNEGEEVLYSYLEWVRIQYDIVLVVDNYQFLSHELRYALEACLGRIRSSLKFVIVDRTIDAQSQITPPLQAFSENDVELSISAADKPELDRIVSGCLEIDADSKGKFVDDIFRKTNGNLKDVEYCLRQYRMSSAVNPQKVDVYGLIATIDRLPLMHRQFLVVVALLDGGVTPELARNAVRRLSLVSTDSELDEILNELIALHYVKLNTASGDQLRAGHERIIQVMRELAANASYDDVRRSLLQEILSVLENNGFNENETYLLHCLVGIQTATELKSNLHFVSRLVRAQHRLDQFSYLVNLAAEIGELLPLLPEDVLVLILDAMQKSSAFDQGLQILRLLQQTRALAATDNALYRYKFLTQLYQYEEAMVCVQDLPKNSWGALYRVGALLSLGRDAEATEATNDELSAPELNEPKAILLRNTVTLFEPEVSLSNLDRAEAYFRRTDSDFRLGTIATNRSFVLLCMRDYDSANDAIENAIEKMRSAGSPEVFQAYFNLAVMHGQQRRYTQAIQELGAALEVVPRSLLLDWVKIDVAKTVYLRASGEISDETALAMLKSNLARIRGLELPYLRRTLMHNIAVLDDAPDQSALINEADRASKSKVSIFLPFETSKESLIVNHSIHWRY